MGTSQHVQREQHAIVAIDSALTKIQILLFLFSHIALGHIHRDSPIRPIVGNTKSTLTSNGICRVLDNAVVLCNPMWYVAQDGATQSFVILDDSNQGGKKTEPRNNIEDEKDRRFLFQTTLYEPGCHLSNIHE